MKNIFYTAFILALFLTSNVALGARDGRPIVEVGTLSSVSAPIAPVQDSVETPDNSQNRSRSGGSRRHIVTTPRGQILGAESVGWENLSPEQKADIIKQLQDQLKEILNLLNTLSADGTIQ